MRIFWMLLALVPILAMGQSAEEIIGKHLEMSGGESNWDKLNSLIIRGSVALTVDEVYNLEIYHRRPSFKKVVFIEGDNRFLNEGFDGKNGYTYYPQKSKNVKIPDYQPDTFESDLMHFKRKGFQVEYLGKANFESQPCYKVKLIKNKTTINFYFRQSDFELIGEENEDEVLIYQKHKNFGGLSFATQIIGRPHEGGEYVLNFREIQINPYIADKEFRF